MVDEIHLIRARNGKLVSEFRPKLTSRRRVHVNMEDRTLFPALSTRLCEASADMNSICLVQEKLLLR